jgi:predicted nucleotidyltransferase
MIDLPDTHLAVVKTLLHQYIPQYEVWAFGSRVDGTAKRHSDLDVVIRGQKEINIQQISNLRLAFEESDLPFRVDVLDWHTLSDEFKAIIMKKHEVLDILTVNFR